MKRTVSIGEAVVWPFLLPGNLVCSALGLSQQNDLVRMLVNSLVWTDARCPRGDICDMTSCAGKLNRISEDGIRRLVDAFYVKVRLDPELAPIFARAIPGDWQPHLTKMYAFWSSVMLSTGRYKGNPVVKHLVIPHIEPHLFERWLMLFDETCGELFDDPIREEFRTKAVRIAESLKLALFYRPDRRWPLESAK